MDFKLIKDNSIIICPNDLKEILIFEANKYPDIRIKFMSKNELIDNVYFTYDDNAITYLIKKGYSYDNAVEILENIKGIKKGNNKLNRLYDIYEELNKEKLLRHNFIFKKLFENKNVYVISYSTLDEELNYILKNELKINYEYIDKEEGKLRPVIHEANDMEEEVNNFFFEVIKLVKKGISLNSIYLYKYPSEYDVILKKYASIYSLPIEFDLNMRLSESKLFKDFMEFYDAGLGIEDAYANIKVDYDDYGANQKLVNILNDVLNIRDKNYVDIKKYIIQKAKCTKLKSRKYDNAIRIISSKINVDGYVFMLGFSLGDYPYIKKDIDFLEDEEKEILHKNTSTIENRISLESLKEYITTQKNLYISRKKFEGKAEKYDSLITNDLQLNKVKIELDNKRYNRTLSEIEVSKYLDEYYDYGTYNKFLHALNEKQIKYKSFDHSFTPSKLFENNKQLNISYTKINSYNYCPFKYFIENLCVKQEFDSTFEMNLGSLFHKILEDYSNNGVINEKDYESLIDRDFITAKEKKFVENILPQVYKVVEKNDLMLHNSCFSRQEAEKNCSLQLDDKTRLIGKVDKILFNDKDDELLVVDYKTGDSSFVKGDVEYGLSLQLPIYGVLLKKEYPNYKQCGIYIQNVTSNVIDDKSFKLKGVTLLDEELFRRIDNGIEKRSIFVDDINVGAKELKEKDSLLKEESYEALIQECERQIKDTVSRIRKGDFRINPFAKERGKTACDYCKLSAICFHDKKDYREIKVTKKVEEEE